MVVGGGLVVMVVLGGGGKATQGVQKATQGVQIQTMSVDLPIYGAHGVWGYPGGGLIKGLLGAFGFLGPLLTRW